MKMRQEGERSTKWTKWTAVYRRFALSIPSTQSTSPRVTP